MLEARLAQRRVTEPRRRDDHGARFDVLARERERFGRADLAQVADAYLADVRAALFDSDEHLRLVGRSAAEARAVHLDHALGEHRLDGGAQVARVLHSVSSASPF